MTLTAKPGGFLSASSNLLDRASLSSQSTLLQQKVDDSVAHFVHQATDWRSLASMTAGGLAYRVGRIGAMGAGSGSLLRAASVGLGFAAEVSIFEGTQRFLNSAGLPSQNLWRWSGSDGLRTGLLHSFITFGTLKGAGRLAQGQNLIAQHLLQDSAMVLGHQITGACGLTPRPTESLAEQFLNAEATNLQIGAGMALGHGLVGGKIHAIEAGLDLSLQIGKREDRFGPIRWRGSPLQHAFAMPAGKAPPEPTKETNLLLMEGQGVRSKKTIDDLLATAPPSVKKLAKELAGDENTSSEFFIKWLVEDLLAKGRNGLSVEEKEFLVQVADQQIEAHRGREDRYGRARSIYWALHDFQGLKRMAQVLEEDNFDRWEAHMFLEEYEEAFHLFDLTVKNLYKGMPSENRIFYYNTEEIREYAEKFAASRGYGPCVTYSPDQAVSALRSLSKSYDLIVAIARGGLFSGAMAEFLDLPVKVIEVHAHDREYPTAAFIDEIRPEEITGKRILFLDKDTVTGASIREAVELFAPFRPAALGAFFNFEIGNVIPKETAEGLRKQGITLHFPGEVEPPPSLPLFYWGHEKLGSPLGRFRQTLRALEDLVPLFQKESPEGAQRIQEYLDLKKKAYFSFNPLLEGVDKIRELMVLRLDVFMDSLLEMQKMDEGRALSYFLKQIDFDSKFPMEVAAELARGRYFKRGLDLAEQRTVENIHVPHSYAASFRAAENALKDRYDIALIVGPEGFAYEPIFRDLGLETVAVNIPEADFGGGRSISIFDNLTKLTGKRVLVIEDDVQSGATLQKLLEELRLYEPGFLGLYLGSPAVRQLTQNIPPDFKKVYVTEIDEEKDDAAFLNHLRQREVTFKDQRPAMDRRKP